MIKKFRSITATAKAQERRLSKRFTVPESNGGENGGSAPSTNGTSVHFRDPEQFIRSEFDQLNRNLSATGEKICYE